MALKILPESFAADSERLHRFEQESRAVAALNHPNILAIYDVGESHDVPFLVSELLEGESLRAVLDRGALPQRKVIDYGVQIAQGLAAAHGEMAEQGNLASLAAFSSGRRTLSGAAGEVWESAER